MDPEVVAIFIPIVAIIGGLTIAGLSIHHGARLKELARRERMAMIEKGMTPPPEPPEPHDQRSLAERRPARFRRVGVTLVGLGLGVMFLISLLEDLRAGVAVGGFLVILGLAFFVNSALESRQLRKSERPLPAPASPPAPPSPPTTPGETDTSATP